MTEERRDPTTPVPAVLLGGGRDRGPLAEATGQPIRGLIPILGRPMAIYPLDALTASGTVGEVVAVGPVDLSAALPEVRCLPEGADLLANIETGLSAFRTDGPVLLLTVDLPFLTPRAVDDFVRRSLATGADLCYPIVPRSVNEARFPGMKRTYAKLREGSFTGGNMMLVRAGFFREMAPLVSEAYAARKRPLVLARRIGVGLLIRLLLGRLSVARIEDRIGRMLSGTVKAIVTDYAEIGADVDRPEDFAAAERILSGD